MIIYNVSNNPLNIYISNEKEYKNYKFWNIIHYNEKNEWDREDGPALERSNGGKLWYKNNKRHREDGPAVEYPDEYKEYWYNDQRIPVNSDKEFKKYLKMKVFI
jgi:hypothetical protein